MKLLNSHSYRQEVIKNFMPTIKYWARHYHYRFHRVLELEDLETVGVIGLIDAMNKYNRKKKNQFKTYAEFRIRGEIIDELRKHDWMTRSERTKQKKYRAAKNKLTLKLGREPSRQEIFELSSLADEDFSRIEQYEYGDPISPFIDTLSIDKNDLKTMEFDKYSLKKTLEVILDDLPRRMRLILVLKYFEDLNFFEISKVINLSEGRICQLHAEAIELIKKHLDKDQIDLLAA